MTLSAPTLCGNSTRKYRADHLTNVLLSGCARVALLVIPLAIPLGVGLSSNAEAQTTLTSSNSTVNLANYIGGNPFTIGAATTITGTTAGIVGNTNAWTLNNSGTITGNPGPGINLTAGGTVTNNAGGVIAGADTSLSITGGLGAVTNSGVITSATARYGVSLLAGGSLTNLAGGIITGSNRGAEIWSGDGVVTNAGTISSTDSEALDIRGNGTVFNQGAASLITGASGIIINNNGTVTNDGTILAHQGTGVSLGGGSVTNTGSASQIIATGYAIAIHSTVGGSVGNAAGATIAGGVKGVYIYGGGPGTVTNAGTIQATGTIGIAVFLANGGSVDNQAGATITAATTGINVAFGFGTVTNAGTITATAGKGVNFFGDFNDSLTNEAGALIQASGSGVSASNGAATVLNDGTISSSGGHGIYLLAGGRVTNDATGLISAYNDGVRVSGAAGTVDNQGTITSAHSYGVKLNGSGSVTNHTAAVINGYNDGARIDSGVGTITNYGAISGYRHRGVYLRTGGTVTNEAGATITGGNDGVYIYSGVGTVTNAGTITGTNVDGVRLYSGGSVVNEASGRIIAGTHGVIIENAGSIANYGYISGGRYGAFLGRAAAITNHAGATITSSGFGVFFYTGLSTLNNAGTIFGGRDGVFASTYSSTASFTNSGTVTGANYGVRFSTGGTIDNQAGGIVTGGGDGIEIEVGGGTITNAGIIQATGTIGNAVVFSNAGGTIGNTLSNSGLISGVATGIKAAGATTVAISNSGTIQATGINGVAIDLGNGGGELINSGTVNSTEGIGVHLGSGRVFNLAGGLIQGATYGIQIGAGGMVINGGTILDAPAPHAAGASLASGASLINQSGGLISGATGAIFTGDGASVTNAGIINGTSGAGVSIGGTSGNSLSNVGQINGITAGVLVTGGVVQIVNTGTITASGASGVGVLFTGGSGTIDNFGMISGAGGTSIKFAGGTNELILESGGTLSGIADGSNGTNTLVVIGTGTLDNVQVTGFQTVEFESAVVPVGAGSTVANAVVSMGTLTNAGTLTGAITIDAGTSLINNGVITDDSLTNAGLLNNSAALTNNGLLTSSGTFINSGMVTNNGLLINSGTLDNSGTIIGTPDGVTSGGNITNSGTIIGTTGTGVVLTGGGTLNNLAGALIQGGQYGVRAMSGDVIFNAGTIIDDLTAGASLGNGATLTNQSSGTIGGVIGVIFTGTGASVTNSGTITGSGGIAVQFNAGVNTLTLDTGSVLNGIVDGGGGAGQVVLQGTGTLNDKITHFGAGSMLSIASNANWLASGNLAIASVRNAGTLQPGVAGNPLKLTGNFAQTAGGVLQVALESGGGGSQLQVTGTASLAGSVRVVPGGTFLAPNTAYTIVTATGGVSGTFSSVSSGSLLLEPVISYDANDAFINLYQLAVKSLANTPNQFATAAAVDRAFISNPGAFNAGIVGLDQLNGPQVRAALDRLSGEVYTGFATTALQAGSLFAKQVQHQGLLAGLTDQNGPAALAASGGDNRLQLGAPIGDSNAALDHPWGLWMSGYGQTGQFGGDGNTHNLNETIAGGAAGVDYQLMPSLRIGAAFGYGETHFSLDNANGRGEVDRTQFGLYAGYNVGPAYITGLLSMAFGDGHVHRDLSLPGAPAHASGRVGDTLYLASAEAGYVLAFPGIGTLTPFAGLTLDSVDQNGVLPNGSNALDLVVHSQSVNSTQTRIGGRFAKTVQLGGVNLAGALELGWAHEFSRTARGGTVAFSGNAGDSFQTYGAGLPGDSAIVGVGIAAMTSADTSLYLHYDGDLSDNASTHTITAGFRWIW
jgi:uncharacterized protein with beta-barrel porin domain